jgi:hypothetical protein
MDELRGTMHGKTHRTELVRSSGTAPAKYHKPASVVLPPAKQYAMIQPGALRRVTPTERVVEVTASERERRVGNIVATSSPFLLLMILCL